MAGTVATRMSLVSRLTVVVSSNGALNSSFQGGNFLQISIGAQIELYRVVTTVLIIS